MIEYQRNAGLTVTEFRDLLRASGLGKRRPLEDTQCLQGMLENSNLCITAWDGNRLVGIARSVTDYHYACYLSDLAVAGGYQDRGIGRQLQIRTREALGPRCKLILLAAPGLEDYYGSLGYVRHAACFVLERDAPFG